MTKRQRAQLPMSRQRDASGVSYVPDRHQLEAGNLFMSYRRGWIDGATGRRKSDTFMRHTNPKLTAAYEVGYDHAAIAYDGAVQTAMATYGYEPSILRCSSPLASTTAGREETNE